MSDDFVRFFAEGTPRPAGSKFAQGVRIKDPASGRMVPKIDPKTGQQQVILRDASGGPGADWRKTVKEAGKAAMVEGGLVPFAGPLRVTVVFHMRRPQSHFRSNGDLKPTAPRWHTSRPDVDKLSRSVLDALKGVTWGDDSQVVYKEALKPYCDLGQPEGVEVAVQILDPKLAPESAQMELT